MAVHVRGLFRILGRSVTPGHRGKTLLFGDPVHQDPGRAVRLTVAHGPLANSVHAAFHYLGELGDTADRAVELPRWGPEVRLGVPGREQAPARIEADARGSD